MNLARTTVSARYLGAAAFSVLVVGAGAGAALADPAAQTHNYFAQVVPGTRPDDRAGIRGANGPSFVTAPVRTAVGVRPDDRAGYRGVNRPSFGTGPAQTTSPVRPDDRAGIRGIDSTMAAASDLSIGGSSRFDWADAGVGAGSTLGLVLLASGLLLARGRLRVPASHA